MCKSDPAQWPYSFGSLKHPRSVKVKSLNAAILLYCLYICLILFSLLWILHQDSHRRNHWSPCDGQTSRHHDQVQELRALDLEIVPWICIERNKPKAAKTDPKILHIIWPFTSFTSHQTRRGTAPLSASSVVMTIVRLKSTTRAETRSDALGSSEASAN